eukprot:jgi/Chrzof1/1969/Cz10g28100.t1
MLYVSADVSNGLGAKHSHSAVAPSRQLPAVPPSNGTFMQPTNTTGSNSGNASSPTQPSQSTIRSDPICVCAREGLTDTCTAAKDQYCATAGANNDFCLEYVPLLQTKSWEAALEVATFLDKACHIAQTGSHSEVDLCSCFKDPTSDACAQTRVHECEFNNPRCLPLLLGLAAGQDHINNLLQAAFTCTALQMTDESVQLDMAFAGISSYTFQQQYMSDVKQTVSDMTGVGSDNINVLTVMYLTNATAATAGQNTGRKLLADAPPAGNSLIDSGTLAILLIKPVGTSSDTIVSKIKSYVGTDGKQLYAALENVPSQAAVAVDSQQLLPGNPPVYLPSIDAGVTTTMVEPPQAAASPAVAAAITSPSPAAPAAAISTDATAGTVPAGTGSSTGAAIVLSPPPPATAAPGSSAEGLSTGAVVGIAVGVAVVAIIASFITLGCRKQRKRKAHKDR